MREQLKLESIVRDLEKSFSHAWDTFADYGYELMSNRREGYYEETLRESMKSIYVRLQYAYEALGLASFLGELRSGFDQYRDKLTSVEWSSLGHPVLPALDYLAMYFRPLKASIPAHYESDRIAEIQRLEQILLGTPKLIKDRNLEPSKEADVTRAMYELLIHPYPDTVRDVPIAKQSKTYKPDIGIPTLKAAIEYKFADSLQELKRSLGGIYEDVLGYAGSDDWKVFFAVIYTTESFMTQAQVTAEFNKSKVDRAWKPLLVVGRGARRGSTK